MRPPLLTLGLLTLIIGVLWVGQGTGYFPYPASSFMVRQTQWAYYGGGLALLGLVLIASSRRV
ncbi:hypothetical protein [Bradyrhizobium prioriisuperbiae]|uniref:hypothetical protein n=1 Tax=Bradyrhizobium prioriisuperbiae TaxID=2854389 RepID=UPI0028E9706E|nr:hypothetical protein [Bradyrhizobium prioritasuperba]